MILPSLSYPQNPEPPPQAINTLPDLHEHSKSVQAAVEAYGATKTQRMDAKLRSQMKYTKWPEVHVVA
jgi:hypothetical protein